MSGHAYLKDLFKKAEMLGWVFEGLDGNNHPRMHHPDTGERYTLSFTPSDWRAEKNAIAHMERISGRKLPRANAGKLHHRRVTQMNPTRTEHEEKCTAAVSSLVFEAEELRREFNLLSQSTDRTAAAAARKVLDRYRLIEQECTRMRRIIPAITEVA